MVARSARRLVLRDNRVSGVELEDGTVLKAHAVVSTLNPEQTFLELLKGQRIAPELREEARENYEMGKTQPVCRQLGRARSATALRKATPSWSTGRSLS